MVHAHLNQAPPDRMPHRQKIEELPTMALAFYKDALARGAQVDAEIYSIALDVVYKPLVDPRVRAVMECPSCGLFYTERQIVTAFMKGHAFYGDEEVRTRFKVLQRILDDLLGVWVDLVAIRAMPIYLWEQRRACVRIWSQDAWYDLETLEDVAGARNAKLVSRVTLDTIFDFTGKLSPIERDELVTQRLRVHPDLQHSGDDPETASDTTQPKEYQ